MARVPKGARFLIEAEPGAPSNSLASLEPKRKQKRAKEKIFTPALGAKICNIIATGVTRTACAGKAGVSPYKLKAWLAASEAGELLGGEDFYEEFIIAEAEGQALHEERFIEMTKDRGVKASNVAAQKIFLSGRFTDWNPKQRVEHTGKDGDPIGVVHGTIYDFLKPAYKAEMEARQAKRKELMEGTVIDAEFEDAEGEKIVRTKPKESSFGLDPLAELKAELASGDIDE